MQRIGAVGVGAHGGQGVAHGGEIDHAGHAGEILQQHARGHEADFLGVGAGDAAGDVSMSAALNAAAVFVAQQVFEQDLGGEGQAGDVADAVFFQRGEAEVAIFRVAHAQLRRRAKGVGWHQFDYRRDRGSGLAGYSGRGSTVTVADSVKMYLK